MKNEITNKQIGLIHVYLAKLNWLDSKYWHIQQITGKKMGFTYLTVDDGSKVIEQLKGEFKVRGKKTRGKIIHYLCLLGYVQRNGSADYSRINHFIQNIGANNQKKERLHDLGLTNLNAVCTQVEQMYAAQIRKR